MTAYYTQVSRAPVRTSSELLPALTGWFAQIGQTIFKAFEAAGRARARRDLIALAERYEAQQPSFAQELRVAALRADQA